MTSFPTGLDTFTNPNIGDVIDAADVGDLNDAVEALEAKVGVDSSLVATSLDKRVATLEAAGGGGGISEGRLTSHHQFPGIDIRGATPVGRTAGVIYYEPRIFYEDATIDDFAVYVTTSAASTNARLGLYHADANWQPTSLVLDVGTVDVAFTGVRAFGVSQAVTAGRYLCALHCGGSNNPGLRAFYGSMPGGMVRSTLADTNMLTQELRKTLTYAVLANPGVAWDTQDWNGSGFYNCVAMRLSAA